MSHDNARLETKEKDMSRHVRVKRVIQILRSRIWIYDKSVEIIQEKETTLLNSKIEDNISTQ